MEKTNDPFIQDFLNGNPSAFKKIYTRSFPKIQRYIVSHNGSKVIAEDIFQNALTLLFVKLKNEELQIQSFENYLFTVCKNLWRRECSKNRVTDHPLDTLVDESVDLATFSLEQSQWDLYKEKFNELSDNCKVLLNKVFNKIPYRDIMIALGYASEGVARQRVFKCKARLIQLVKKDKRYRRLKH